MLVYVLDDDTAQSQLLYYEVQRDWPSAKFIRSELNTDPCAVAQSLAAATNYDTAMLLRVNPDGYGPVDLNQLEYVTNMVIPRWERKWILKIPLSFADAYVFTKDLPPIDEKVQTKLFVIGFYSNVREMYSLKEQVTVFFLGSNTAFNRSVFREHESIHRVDPHPDGIYAAHKRLAELCPTKAFMVIDEDNQVMHFPVLPEVIRHNLIFHAENPYNGLIYGHGGLKVFLRSVFIGSKAVPPDQDMTLWVSQDCGLEVIETSCSRHVFNRSYYKGWRAAFRECYKLARQADDDGALVETEMARCLLDDWLLPSRYQDKDKNVLLGAIEGERLFHVNPRFPINREDELQRHFKASVIDPRTFQDKIGDGFNLY